MMKSWARKPTDFLTYFVAALIVVKGFLRFITGHTFRVFAWYRIILGAFMLLAYARIG